MSVVEADSDADDGNQELADQHAESTVDEERSSTELLNRVEGDRGRANVDEGEDQRDQEDVADSTGGLQERCGVVEDEVDTRPLLHHLKRGTEDGSSQVRLLVAQGTAEAVCPAAEPACGGNDLSLVLFIGNDLGKLSLDVLGLDRLTSQST